MPSKGDATRQRIVETAAMIFWRTSYRATSMNDVCRAAKVNKATAYEYFSSKQDLALATIDDNVARTIDCIFDGSFDLSTDPRKRLAAIFDRVYETHAAVAAQGEPCRGCPFVNIGNELGSEDPAIRQRIEQGFAKFRTYYEAIVRDAKNMGYTKSRQTNRALGSAFVGVMNGAMTAAKIENRPEAILDAKKTALYLLCS